MAQSRKSEISYLNIILCLFVIFIHIISFAVSNFQYGTLSYNLAMFPWRMVSFVVQGFILLSGVKLFLTKKDEQKYGHYLVSRIKGVILPYVFSYVIYYVFYFLVYDYPLDIVFITKHLLLGSLVCHFYFIPLLFQFDLLFPVWKRIINNCSPIIVIPFILLFSLIFEIYFPNMVSTAFPNINFIYNDRLFTTYLAYWIIGCYIGKYYDKFTEILEKNFKAICVCFTISLALFFYYTYLAFNYITYIPFMNQVHSLYSICVIVFLYALFMKLPKNIPSILQKMDRASYDIYLWHMLFVFFANFIIEKLAVQSQLLGFGVRAVCAYGLTITACFVWNDLKKRIFKKNS
ncbi:MAG: acyltransferase [Clostridia bacterium]|nr:acyltransferase [Clostridia bacterium]